MTKELRSYKIDERYSLAERIQIDGIVLAVFGIVLFIYFSFIYILYVELRLLGDVSSGVVGILLLFVVARLDDYFSTLILARTRILKDNDTT